MAIDDLTPLSKLRPVPLKSQTRILSDEQIDQIWHRGEEAMGGTYNRDAIILTLMSIKQIRQLISQMPEEIRVQNEYLADVITRLIGPG